MSKMMIRRNVVYIVCICIMHMLVHGQVTSNKKDISMLTDEESSQFLTVINRAGYHNTVPSLIEALKNGKGLVPAFAAALLSNFPQSEQAVVALEAAFLEKDEDTANYAAHSLLRMGNRRWVQKAVARLPFMKHPMAQIQLSSILARAGNTKGLKYVLNGAIDDSWSGVSLYELDYFDGKLNEKGKRIVVLDELTSLVEKAQPKAKEKILEKIRQLRGISGK